MLAPLRSNATRRQTSTIRGIKAPFGGWNASDDVTDMPEEDAIVLDNLIPGDGSVALRKGIASHATGLGAAVRSLMEWNAAGSTAKLFGATASAIYDVTSAGAVGAAAVSSLSNGNWQSVNFQTAGGNFLVLANGADSVRNYDGSSWTTPSITGVTSSTLATVTVHQSRLWFCQVDTLKVWYLPTLSIAGAATAIDLRGLATRGGHVVNMASWTRDSGSGIDDIAVFITSRGEIILFQGSDPSSAATWSKIGTFKVAEPIGRNCFIKVGGDVGILTTQGLVPLAGVLARAEAAQANIAITDKIRNAFTSAYNDAGTANGWQVIEYPREKLLIINVPITEATEQMQFVMNALNGKWCRFTGIDAGCWSLLNTELYLGGNDGTVYKYTGTTDAGTAITAKAVSAFSMLGTPVTKNLRRVLPLFFGPSGYRPQVGSRLDYGDDETLSPAVTYDTSGTAWDEGSWDSASWAPPDRVNKQWQAFLGECVAMAFVVAIESQDAMTYHGAKVEFEVGDHL